MSNHVLEIVEGFSPCSISRVAPAVWIREKVVWMMIWGCAALVVVV